MKKYIYVILLSLLITSCIDTRYDNMVDDSVYFPASDLQEVTVTVLNDDNFVHTIWLHKGGYHQNRFDGKVELNYNYLVEYNNQQNTDYQMLDEQYYSFERNFTIAESVNEGSVDLILNQQQVLKDFGYSTVYIPLSVRSLTHNAQEYADKSNLMLAIELNQPIVGIDSEWKEECRKDFEATDETFKVDITAVMNTRIPEKTQVLYTRDQTLVKADEFELDQAYYSYSSSVTFVENERYAENYLTINVATMPDGEWVIPVRLSSSNPKIGMASDAWLALTVSKGELDDVVWGGMYLQGEQIVLSGSAGSAIEIGEFENSTLTISTDEPWVRATIVGDKIVIEVDQNSATVERVAMVTVKNSDNNLTKSITVRQVDYESGLPLDKTKWTIEAFSDNCALTEPYIPKMFDGKWRKNAADASSYVEFNQRTVGTDPYVITFDLGGEQTLNQVGLMPRQDWTWPAPKRVKLEVSEDNLVWVSVGTGQDASGILPGFATAEVQNNTHYMGAIHWFPFDSAVRVKYLRVYLYESWNQTGNVCCIEEIFASLK